MLMVVQAVSKKFSWHPVESLQRLEGFTDAWEKSMVKGREVPLKTTLRSAGVTAGDVVVVVRRQLIAEGKHCPQFVLDPALPAWKGLLAVQVALLVEHLLVRLL